MPCTLGLWRVLLAYAKSDCEKGERKRQHEGVAKSSTPSQSDAYMVFHKNVNSFRSAH